MDGAESAPRDWGADLRARQAQVDAARADYATARYSRRITVEDARTAGITIYAIAKHLGLTQNAVRKILGLRPPRKPRQP